MLCSWLVSEPLTGSRNNGTGVLRGLTGTHLCDDPPRQGGASPERQPVCCVDCGCLCIARSSYSNRPNGGSTHVVVGSGDLWHFETPRSTTLSYSHPRRCARRARELSSFCTTLTTSGKLFDTPSTKKIPGCPHSIQYISLVVKVSKLIHFQTVGEILQSSGTCPNLTSNTASKDQTTKRQFLVLSLCLVCHTNKPLCHTWRIRSTPAAHVLIFLDIRTCSLELFAKFTHAVFNRSNSLIKCIFAGVSRRFLHNLVVCIERFGARQINHPRQILPYRSRSWTFLSELSFQMNVPNLLHHLRNASGIFSPSLAGRRLGFAQNEDVLSLDFS